MDPQLKMVLTSVGGAVATAAATWAASNGLISAGDQVNFANALVTVGSAAVGGLLVWYAHHQTSQSSMIKAVNETDNGVTVVKTSDANAAGVPTATAPAK
jgi:hypothetical protein